MSLAGIERYRWSALIAAVNSERRGDVTAELVQTQEGGVDLGINRASLQRCKCRCRRICPALGDQVGFLRAALWISLKGLLKHVKNYDHLIPHSVSALSTPINYSDYERAASKKTKNNIYAPLGLFISNRNICRRSGASLVIKKAGGAEEFLSLTPLCSSCGKYHIFVSKELWFTN